MTKNQNTKNKIKEELTEIFSGVNLSSHQTPSIDVSTIEGSVYVTIESSKTVNLEHKTSTNVNFFGHHLEKMCKIAKKYDLEINGINSRTWTWKNTLGFTGSGEDKETVLTHSILLVEKD
jgi:uncharacterized membrane protein